MSKTIKVKKARTAEDANELLDMIKDAGSGVVFIDAGKVSCEDFIKILNELQYGDVKNEQKLPDAATESNSRNVNKSGVITDTHSPCCSADNYHMCEAHAEPNDSTDGNIHCGGDCLDCDDDECCCNGCHEDCGECPADEKEFDAFFDYVWSDLAECGKEYEDLDEDVVEYADVVRESMARSLKWQKNIFNADISDDLKPILCYMMDRLLMIDCVTGVNNDAIIATYKTLSERISGIEERLDDIKEHVIKLNRIEKKIKKMLEALK